MAVFKMWFAEVIVNRKLQAGNGGAGWISDTRQ